MIQDYNYRYQLQEIDIAYKNLSSAFMNRNRRAIEIYCNQCNYLDIPHFQERVYSRVSELYSYARRTAIPVVPSLNYLPYNDLMLYAQACQDVLFNEQINWIRQSCQYNYQTLTLPRQYQESDVLYSRSNGVLTVGNFLKVLKYAISIAEIIKPEDKRFSNASASILALQSLYHLFSNSSKTELTNHTLHVAIDFLASNVKDSLTEINAKRNVAISAFMANLAIDFLVRD